MPKNIYNEGRVVGFSSYEVYVKQHAEIDPDTPPATEREWLASSLAMGASMLLKIPAEAENIKGPHNVEIPFPAGTQLCAASTVIANLFTGKGYYGSAGQWAKKIESYSPLISNDASASPDGSSMPMKPAADWEKPKRELLVEYMKVIDGVILQPGTWTDNEAKPPQKDFSPDLSKTPILRLLVADRIERDIEILFTGFSIRTVVSGEVVLDSAVNTLEPDSGDFLGPGAYPWAVKIAFSVPTSAINYLFMDKYRRKIPETAQTIHVDDTAVIDMRTTDPKDYYLKRNQASRQKMNVDDFMSTGEGDAVLTVYQRPSVNDPKTYEYPPALWGTYVTTTGENYLHPLDVVAPGVVKMFPSTGNDAKDQAQLKDYQDTFPGAWGMVHWEDGTVGGLDDQGILHRIAKVSMHDINHQIYAAGDAKAKGAVIETGKSKALVVAAGNKLDGSQYTITTDTKNEKKVGNTTYDVGHLGKVEPIGSDITPSAMLEALANDKGIDVLGEWMKALKAGLAKPEFPYIQFRNGLRLYISSKQPTDTDVPIGSIGIGWGTELPD